MHNLKVIYVIVDVKYIITRQPKQAQYAEPVTLSELDFMMNTGRAFHSFISKSEERIVLTISADLGHTFRTDCTDPLYLPDPRFVASIF